MTNTEITPELLRSVATWLRDNAVGALPGKPMAAEFLDGAADDLEREQADEKRIDELGRIYSDAWQAHFGEPPIWDTIDDTRGKAAVFAGIRAVLDKLRIDSYTATCDGKCGDDSPHNAHLTPEGRRHFLAEPRTWSDLRNVPGDVKAVEDRDGNRWYRPPGGYGACLPFTHAAPFTEVIADA